MATTEEMELEEQVRSALRENKIMDLLGHITDAAIDYADAIDAEEEIHKFNAKNPLNQMSSTTDRRKARECLQNIRTLVRELHNT